MENVSFLVLGVALSICVIIFRVYTGIKNNNYSFIGGIVFALSVGFIIYYMFDYVLLSIIIGCGVAAFGCIEHN